jgi:hypothetical protein
MNVELITPIAMEEKQRFAIREGGRTVGAGVVVKSSSNGLTVDGNGAFARFFSDLPGVACVVYQR